MSYGVRFENHALVQLHRCPRHVFDAMLERIVALVDEPWDAHVAAPGDDPALRETTFGGGRGLLSFHVDDAAELIRIYAITWIG